MWRAATAPLLRSGRSMLPDDTMLCATLWMQGVFVAQLTIGNTSLHKLFSVSRDPYTDARPNWSERAEPALRTSPQNAQGTLGGRLPLMLRWNFEPPMRAIFRLAARFEVPLKTESVVLWNRWPILSVVVVLLRCHFPHPR